MQRITKKPSWYSLAHYNNNSQDPKWFVPYAEAHEDIKSAFYPPYGPGHCFHGPESKEMLSEAEKRAASYYSELSAQSNKQ
jgi:hypothetical protein